MGPTSCIRTGIGRASGKRYPPVLGQAFQHDPARLQGNRGSSQGWRSLSWCYFFNPESFSAHYPELDIVVDDWRADVGGRGYIDRVMQQVHACRYACKIRSRGL
jgi:hypothetical protein